MSHIEDLYDHVQKLVTFICKKENLHGNILDTKLKEIFQDEDTPLDFVKWNPELLQDGVLYHTFTKKILLLPERVINGLGEEKILDKNYYMIQIFRIPFQEKPTLLNLLRVSLYCGLIQTTLRNDDFPEGIVKAFKTLKVYKMINFVAKEDCKELNDKLEFSKFIVSITAKFT